MNAGLKRLAAHHVQIRQTVVVVIEPDAAATGTLKK
jgi:hypothetical protein